MLYLTLPHARLRVDGIWDRVHTGVMWQKCLVRVPLVAVAVFKPTRKAALVLPVNRHPAKMHGLILS